jgi:predicted nucleotidyltransferase
VSARTTEPNLEDIAVAVRPLLPPGFGAFLFGSRASGRAGPGSDWDVGLLGPEPLRGALVERIREALDGLRTLHSFDVVDLSTVPEGFRDLALRHAVRVA